MVSVVLLGVYIEFHEEFFGHGEGDAPGATNCLAYIRAHMLFGFMVIPMMLAVLLNLASLRTKGFDLLIKAFRRVVSRVSHAHLVIGGGSLKPTELELRVRRELLELTERLGLLDHVHMVGRIPNEMLPAYYARSRVFVLPSRYDLFGMTAVEALACGTPVVVSKHAGVSRLMRREFSFVVDPEDEEELAEAVAEAKHP